MSSRPAALPRYHGVAIGGSHLLVRREDRGAYEANSIRTNPLVRLWTNVLLGPAKLGAVILPSYAFRMKSS